MDQDGNLSCEFEFELPEQQSARYKSRIAGRGKGSMRGKADVERAVGAFDAARQRPFADVAADIDKNVAGWVQYGVGEIFRRYATERDIVDLVLDPAQSVDEIRQLLAPQFEPWGLTIDVLDFQIVLDDSVLQALPAEAQGRLDPAEAATATGAPGQVTVEHKFNGDIPPVVDPMTNHEMKVRCAATVSFGVQLQLAKQTVDPQGAISSVERVQREAISKAEEWLWYGIKQSFYNWIYDTTKTDRRFVRDYELIHPFVMQLCEDGLTRLGITVNSAMVRYEAMDPDTAWALTAPGQSGSSPTVPKNQFATPAPQPTTTPAPMPAAPAAPASAPQRPRGKSDQAMAATIAVSDPDEFLAQAEAQKAGQGLLPPIEEAVWRHQKRLRKQEPELGKAESAVKIMGLLKEQGYSSDDRKRVAKLIGANPDDVTD